MSLLVVAKYFCEVAGKRTDSVDYRVRYFESDTTDYQEVLSAEEPTSYLNDTGETVTWVFEETMSVQHDPQFTDGSDVIGFITGESVPVATKAVEPTGSATIRR